MLEIQIYDYIAVLILLTTGSLPGHIVISEAATVAIQCIPLQSCARNYRSRCLVNPNICIGKASLASGGFPGGILRTLVSCDKCGLNDRD